MNSGRAILLRGKIGTKPRIVKNFLIFGATGAIGRQCVRNLSGLGTIFEAEKNPSLFQEQISKIDNFDAVIWAQGLNSNDSLSNFKSDSYEKILQANVGYILETAHTLLSTGKVSFGTNFVVVSSIWSQQSRPNKLTYSISKAAASAAVRAMAVELGKAGIQVNAIAPGPIESPMTRKNLSEDQISVIREQTPLNRLVTLEEVANVITKFATGEMSGITGQEINIDGGWGVSKLV